MLNVNRKTNRINPREILIEAIEPRTLMSAAPIGLDPAFGANGVALSPAAPAGYAFVTATNAVNGDVIVAGVPQNIQTMLTPYELERYSSKGVLDTSFGDNGIVTSTFKASPSAIIIQSNGGILVLSAFQDSATDSKSFITQYNANGSVNTHWGTNGTVSFQAGVTAFNPSYPVGFVSLPGGDIAVTGGVTQGTGTLSAVLVLTGVGTPDPSIGTKGLATGVPGVANALAVDSNGYLVTAGQTTGNSTEAFIERFTRVGKFDAAFGTKGSTYTPATRYFTTLHVDSMGIEAAGEPQSFASPGTTGVAFELSHFTTNGTADTSFGSGTGTLGVTLNNIYNEEPALFQTDGKLLLAGATSADGSASFAAVARINVNGLLDTTFGLGGYAKLGSVLSSAYEAGGLSVESSGGIVVIDSAPYGPINGLDFDPTLLLSNGTPDATFGPGGTAAGRPLFTSAGAVIQLSNGQILNAGQVTVGGEDGIYVRRLNANGAVDASFAAGQGYAGQSGYVFLGPESIAILNNGPTVGGLGVDSSGRIYVGNVDVGIVRLTSSGLLDTSFGTMGTASINEAGRFAIEPNGQILVTTSAGLVARLSSSGHLDTGFGKSGVVTPPTGFTLDAGVLAIAVDGKVLVGGTVTAATASTDLAVLRLNSNGSVDSTFGSDGVAVANKLPSETNLGYRQEYDSSAAALAVLLNGTIVLAGTDGGSGGPGTAFLGPTLAEFLPTGQLNPSFGTGGQTITYGAKSGLFGRVYNLIVQADGSLVAVGTASEGLPAYDSQVFLLRYTPTGATDSFITNEFVTSNPNGAGDPNTEQDAAAGPKGTVIVSGYTDSSGYETDALLARFVTDTLGSVSGTVYSDNTGTPANFKTGLAGQVVYADLNNNSRLDAGEPTAVTNASGQYTLLGLPVSPVIIREVLSNKRQSYPTGGSGEHVTVGATAITGVNFAVTADLYLSGSVLTSTSAPLAGVVVYVDLNHDGKLEANEPSVKTSPSGGFFFDSLTDGTYSLRIAVPSGYTQTSPANNNGVSLTLGSGAVNTHLTFAVSPTKTSLSNAVFSDAVISVYSLLEKGLP